MDTSLMNKKLAELEQIKSSRTRIKVVLGELHTLALETRHIIYQWNQLYDIAQNL
jgi:hypothetical protein